MKVNAHYDDDRRADEMSKTLLTLPADYANSSYYENEFAKVASFDLGKQIA